MEYPILSENVEFEEEIKKSRFITYLRPVKSLEDCKNFVEEIRQEHPKARHHCWACVGGKPGEFQEYGCSDDGEPSGTAGKPMLNSLIGSGIGHIAAVCVRYFGGTLLGTGGLVKAYGNGTQQALLLAKTEVLVERVPCRITCPYDFLNNVNHFLPHYDTVITNQDYSDKVVTEFLIPEQDIEALNQQIFNKSLGKIQVEKIKKA